MSTPPLKLTISIQDDSGDLDARLFQERLDRLLVRTANLLEREWPSEYKSIPNAHVIFFTRMRITINTYHSILWLIADSPSDPRKKPLLFSVAPLVRTLFEELVTLLFILRDLPSLIVSLNMTGFTELWIEKQEAERHYDSLPKWQDYIQDLDSQLSQLAKDLNLTPAQVKNPRKEIGRWPTPGRAVHILKQRYGGSTVIPFMEFINAWMYRTLSGDSHLNFPAMSKRGIYLTPEFAKNLFGVSSKEILREHYARYHKDMSWSTYTLLLSIISEIDKHFKFGMKEDLKYLWTIFSTHSDMALDFHETRYRTLLS